MSPLIRPVNRSSKRNEACDNGLGNLCTRTTAKKRRRPVGGEDRAPTCPEAFGETGPTGETGPFSGELCVLSPLRGSLIGGGARENKAAIYACRQRQKCMLRSGTNRNFLIPC